MRVLSFPFRVRGGRIVLTDQGSDVQHVELVAVTVLTRKGERPLVPDFGITDPVFNALDQAELRAALATYGPDVDVELGVRAVTEDTLAYDLTVTAKG